MGKFTEHLKTFITTKEKLGMNPDVFMPVMHRKLIRDADEYEDRYAEIVQFHEGKPPEQQYHSLLDSLLFVARSEREKAHDLQELMKAGWKPGV